MLLTATAFRQIMDLRNHDLPSLPEHLQRATVAKLEYLLENFKNITAIEGVKNLGGAKYLVQERVVEALERLGETVDDLTLDELAVGSFVEGEPLVG